MTLGEVDVEKRSAPVGYWAAPWARNRGATTRAFTLVSAWGFESVGITTIQLMTLPGNVASERVAEKAGFELIGTLDDYEPSRVVEPAARYRVNSWVRRSDPEDPT
jgi:RimJ/RimL family protein N-acetyltransferase